jgi:hypothetical protein
MTIIIKKGQKVVTRLAEFKQEKSDVTAELPKRATRTIWWSSGASIVKNTSGSQKKN